jgi:predicted nuclease with TOPRIM domain
MFTFNFNVNSHESLGDITDKLQELNTIMSELLNKVTELESKVDAEIEQGAAVLVQVSELTGLSMALQAEVDRLAGIVASLPDAADLPSVLEALDRITVKVMGIIPDAPVEEPEEPEEPIEEPVIEI